MTETAAPRGADRPAATATSLPAFPMPRACPYHPPPGYADLRRHGPLAKVVLRGGQVAWVVTGHAEARALFADPRLSPNRAVPGYPELTGRRVPPEAIREVQTFVELDQPEHGTQRRMAIPSFSLRRIRAMRAGIQAAVDRLLDGMLSAGPPADLVAELAVPVPAFLLCEVFGVPEHDRELFAGWMRMPDGEGLPELSRYLGDLLRTKRSAPGDDLLTSLRARADSGELTQRRLLNTVMMIVAAGSETTTNAISLGALALLEHPVQLTRLRANPSTLPAAVEELLRYVSVVDTIPRVAVADIDIAGRRIRTGEGVVLSTAAANRDEDVFADADVLDVGRPARQHLAFGYGMHQCLGQNLARTALEVVFGTLLARCPNLQLDAPVAELPRKGAVGLQGVTALPVTW